MMHTESDSAQFEAMLLLLLGTSIGAVYALLVALALAGKKFRWPTVLYTSYVLSAIASIPWVLAQIRLWPYLTELRYSGSSIDLISLPNAVLLCFAVMAPTVQYWFLRRKRRAARTEIDRKNTA
ncbi:MAG: hypothetical protein WBC44_17950 [Planctomycetaceae bacterium]